MLVSILLMHTSYVICILWLAKSLGLTHYWCLGIDPEYEDDTFVEAPVVGDCGWGPADQEVELEVGEPTPGVWVSIWFLGLSDSVVSMEVDWYVKLINLHSLTFRLDFHLATFDISFMIPYASAVITIASALLFMLPQFNHWLYVGQKVLNWTHCGPTILKVLGFSWKSCANFGYLDGNLGIRNWGVTFNL